MKEHPMNPILKVRRLKRLGDTVALRAIVTEQRHRLSLITERDYHHRAAILADPMRQVAPVGDRSEHLLRARAASKDLRLFFSGSRALRRAAEMALASVERRMARAS
jgi:hypothetical protein